MHKIFKGSSPQARTSNRSRSGRSPSIARRTIHDWSKNNAKFNEFFNHLKTHQEQSLLNKVITHKWHSRMAQFTLENFGHAKPPSKTRQGMDHDNLIHEITLQIEDAKNTIQTGDGKEDSSDRKHDGSQVIDKEETNSKRVITLD